MGVFCFRVHIHALEIDITDGVGNFFDLTFFLFKNFSYNFDFYFL